MNRNNRKNVISCVTVGESDNEEQLPSKPLTYHQKQLQNLRSTPVIYQSTSKNSNIQVKMVLLTITKRKIIILIMYCMLSFNHVFVPVLYLKKFTDLIDYHIWFSE